MKKAVITVVLFSMLLSIFTASTLLAVDGSKGSTAPVFKFENNDTTLSLDKMRGEWILLQFWASSDAKSRLDMKRYTAINTTLTSDADNAKLSLIGVNLDNNEMLFREIVQRDGLASNTQFYAEKNRADRLKSAYHLDRDGYGVFLINPEGKIVAKNPSKQQIQSLINKAA